jgi:hypothetical protein
MQLIRFGEKGKEKPGILLGGTRFDCSQYFQDWDREFFQSGGIRSLDELLSDKGNTLPIVPEEERWGLVFQDLV